MSCGMVTVTPASRERAVESLASRREWPPRSKKSALGEKEDSDPASRTLAQALPTALHHQSGTQTKVERRKEKGERRVQAKKDETDTLAQPRACFLRS